MAPLAENGGALVKKSLLVELFQENAEKNTDERSEVVGDANLQVRECWVQSPLVQKF